MLTESHGHYRCNVQAISETEVTINEIDLTRQLVIDICVH